MAAVTTQFSTRRSLFETADNAAHVILTARKHLHSCLGGNWHPTGEAENGGSNTVYKMVDQDGRTLALRICKDSNLSALVLRGQKILKHLKVARPELAIPSVLLETEAYSILEWIAGSPIGLWHPQRLNFASRQTTIHSLATQLYGIWTCDVPGLITSSPPLMTPSTYRQHLHKEVDRGLGRAITQDGDWGDPLWYLSRRSMIDAMLPAIDEPGCVVRHGDLAPNNIICDDRGVQGIIDWDVSSLVPAAAAIHYPLFIANIPGLSHPYITTEASFEYDRQVFVERIKDLQQERPSAIPVVALLEGCRPRQFFELSLHNRRLNAKYAETYCAQVQDKRTLLAELEDFLLSRPELSTHPRTLSTRQFLAA